MTTKNFNKTIQRIAGSTTMDVIGITIIVGAVIMLGFYKTPLSASWLFKGHTGLIYTLPLIGIISTLSAIASVMSTRLVAKVNNFGNIIGWINTIFSGLIDFLLGNIGAILTYPISIYLNYKASQNWQTKAQNEFGKIKHYHRFLAILSISAIIIGFGLNFIGFWLASIIFHTSLTLNFIYYFASITFTLSLIANVLNVFKLPSQWSFWAIYNIAQLGKAISLGNIANVAKLSLIHI